MEDRYTIQVTSPHDGSYNGLGPAYNQMRKSFAEGAFSMLKSMTQTAGVSASKFTGVHRVYRLVTVDNNNVPKKVIDQFTRHEPNNG